MIYKRLDDHKQLLYFIIVCQKSKRISINYNNYILSHKFKIFRRTTVD